MLTPFEAFQLHSALKNHFTVDSYSFVKYNGKTRVTKESFLKRKDKYFYSKLAKHKDPFNCIVASMLIDKTWIGDIISEQGQKTYLAYERQRQSLKETFREDIVKLEFSVKQLLELTDDFPRILSLFQQNEISVHTVLIMDILFNIFELWGDTDHLLLPLIRRKIYKYKELAGPTINRAEYARLCKELFESKELSHQ
jgi:hypothetical protein